MVVHVLRLRLDLLIGALRGDRARVMRTLIEAVLLIVATVAVCLAVASLGTQPASVALTVTVLIGAALVLGVLIGPAASGVEDQLDPRRFVVFGADPRLLAGSSLLGSFVSLPSFAMLAISCTIAATWTAQGVNGALAWVFVLLGFATCVVLARVSMAVASLVLQERRSREMTGLFVVAVIVIIVPVAVFFTSLEWDGVVPEQLKEAISFLALTPFGAAWAVPGLVAVGESTVAVVWAVVIAVATLAAVVAAWFAVVSALMHRIDRPTSGRERGGLGWFAMTPGTPGGAIAARSLVYWLRDRRYILNLVVVPIAAVVAMLPLVVAGVPVTTAALIPVPIMALFLGWMPHNDVAYDSTAVWLHIVSGVRGISDRVGRLVPIALVSIPLLAVALAISVAFHGRWSVLPALIGVTVCLFLSGLGLSSISSVISPYPVTRPGDSPFQQPQRAGSGTGSQALVLVGALALSIPTLWLAWLAVSDDISLTIPAMWLGIGSGLIVLAAGLAIGAALFDRRGSAMMEFAEAI